MEVHREVEIESCPWLPAVDGRLGPESTRRFAEKRDEFYLAALGYAQSLWREGKPAQAILQLNKAWMADLTGDEEVLKRFPPPYEALVWLMAKARDGGAGFMGDPVRHFQHLASRMSGPRSEVRSWRAWACFHLAERVLEGGGFSRDGRQLCREGIMIPGWAAVAVNIHRLGWAGEGGVLERCRGKLVKGG